MQSTPVHFALNRGAVILASMMMAACSWLPTKTTAPEPPKLAASAPVVAAEVPLAAPMANLADAALAQGLKAYQAAQYTTAETQLNTALQSGLKLPADVAKAQKHLAFIYCTSRREAACAKAFKAARAADPSFALTKAEAGHPMWGPVYRKVAKQAVKPQS